MPLSRQRNITSKEEKMSDVFPFHSLSFWEKALDVKARQALDPANYLNIEHFLQSTPSSWFRPMAQLSQGPKQICDTITVGRKSGVVLSSITPSAIKYIIQICTI